jgi:hypothetical protein
MSDADWGVDILSLDSNRRPSNSPITNALVQDNMPAIILHGHLHMPYLCSDAVDIVSCGSALFDPEGPLKTHLHDGPSAFVLFVEGDQVRIRCYQESEREIVLT